MLPTGFELLILGKLSEVPGVEIAGAVDVSQRKARTSALFPLPSGEFGAMISEQQLTGMELSNGGLAAFHGGLPIMDGDSLIGAIGVSGGSAGQDLDVAQSALGMDQTL